MTSLHKPGPPGREGAAGESGARGEPGTQMTRARLPAAWGWAVCECLFWMRRRRVQLPGLSTVHRPSWRQAGSTVSFALGELLSNGLT